MPTDSSNFSTPDQGVPQQPYRPTGTGDNGETWDPVQQRWIPRDQMPAVGGAAGTAPDPTRAPTPQTVMGAWGHRGDSLDANGRAIAGTNGMAQDVDRYRAMGAGHQVAPQIDRAASNETRGYGMGALGLLRARAEGAATPAQTMSRQQTAGAVNAVQSGAASIKGGAGARAAAARSAGFAGARIQAQGDQDTAALAAREQAEGANAYFGAANTQRGLDLGAATEQAKLEAGQRGQNDNREGFYEGLAQDTQVANLNHQLGRSEADAASAQAAYNNNVARDEASYRSTMDWVNRGLGGGTGLVGAVNAVNNSENNQQSAPTPAGPSSETGGYGTSDTRQSSDDKNDISTSDMRAKDDVRPLMSGATPKARVRAKADAQVYDHSMFARHADEAPVYETKDVNAAIERDNARAAALEQARQDRDEDDRAAYRASLPKERYAASRAGQPGAMFGGPAPEAEYRSRLKNLPSEEPRYGYFDSDGRDLTTSDPKAKQEAYALGRAHGFEQVTTGKPVEWSHPMPKDIVDKNEGRAGEGAEQAPTREPTSFKRERPAAPTTASLTAPKGAMQRGVDALAAHPFTTSPGSPWAGTEAVPAFQKAAVMADKGYRSALADTPPDAARAMTSDQRAKEDVHHFGGPMHDANLSMAPSSYEYKPEFTPPDQKPGEKNVGPMANNMEADPVAKTAIVKDPNTGLLAIDKTKGLKLVMGGLADLQRQVDAMQERKRA